MQLEWDQITKWKHHYVVLSPKHNGVFVVQLYNRIVLAFFIFFHPPPPLHKENLIPLYNLSRGSFRIWLKCTHMSSVISKTGDANSNFGVVFVPLNSVSNRFEVQKWTFPLQPTWNRFFNPLCPKTHPKHFCRIN